MTYPNGDRDLIRLDGLRRHGHRRLPRPDGDETSEVAWFDLDRLPYEEMSAFTLALLCAVGLGPAAT